MSDANVGYDDTATQRQGVTMPGGEPSTWAGVIVLGCVALLAVMRRSFRRVG